MPKVLQARKRRRSRPRSSECNEVRSRSTHTLFGHLLTCFLSPDLQELTLGNTMKMTFPNPDDILNFTLTIEPDEGMYKGGVFNFSFSVNQNFPHDPPKVKCTQKIYHPNIDLEGNVCLNILREDWKPVLNLNAVIVGMQVRHSPFVVDSPN
jgi:ubiquitin-protein ligase